MRRPLALGAALFATAALVAASPSDVRAADGANAGASVTAGEGAQGALVHYNHLFVSSDGRFIEPCIDVLRGLRLASFLTNRVYAEFSFSYVSRGEETSQTFLVALRDFEVEGHTQYHTAPAGYQELDGSVDLGDDRIDEDQDVDASVRIVTLTANGKRVSVPGVVQYTQHVNVDDTPQ